MSEAATRFWRRSREWPFVGQVAFALLVIFVAVAVTAEISHALRGGRADRPAAGPARSATSGPRPTGSSRLLTLTIAPQTHVATYDRAANFGGWIDQHGCQDTRAVLLIRASRAVVTFTSSSRCTVMRGRWVDPWSGVVATVAHALQVDHTVPLHNAWVSGAWSWSQARRVAYANDLVDADHLVAIAASENESKGAEGPDEWRPPSSSAWCRYALAWDRVKAKWHLTATPAEWEALVAMARTC